MSRAIAAARGVKDYLPPSHRAYTRLVTVAEQIAWLSGYERMTTPIIEKEQLFRRAVGEHTDIIGKEMYRLAQRGSESLVLRPENTAGAVRALLNHGYHQQLPQRWFYAGPMFRYERPQAGRLRQFHQFGIEAFGTAPDVVADVEVISCGYMTLCALLGGAARFQLQINTLGTTAERHAWRANLIQYFERHQAQLSADSQRRLSTNPLRILDSKAPEDRALCRDAPTLLTSLHSQSARDFAALGEALAEVGIAYVINPHLVRGLDYYSHTVFEFVVPDAADVPTPLLTPCAGATVLAGGRYDHLSTQLGASQPIAGVGYAAGIERLLSLLPAEAYDTDSRRWLGVIATPSQARQWQKLLTQLRAQQQACRLFCAPNPKKAFVQAEREQARCCLLQPAETLVVRDLRSGAEIALGSDVDAPELVPAIVNAIATLHGVD